MVSKASSVALEIFPSTSVSNAHDFLTSRHRMGWQVVGSGPPTDGAGADVRLDRPTVLVLGSEGAGIPEDIHPLCHSGFLRLEPGRTLHPGLDSLNVSVAAALLVQKLKSTCQERFSS